MKKTLFVTLAFAITGSALAASPNLLAPLPVSPAAKSAYSYELGMSMHRETYEEFDVDGKLMQEVAPMAGIKGGVARAIGENGGTLVLSGELDMGQAEYTGSYIGGNYGDLRQGGLRRRLVDVSVTYKQTAPAWNGLTVGAGLGYRRLVDNLQDSGAGGYKRINERTYLTVGLEQAFNSAQWSITPGVKYKHPVSSKQTSPDLLGGISVDQPTGYGAEASLAIVKKEVRYRIAVTPFIRVWEMRDSDIHRSGLYEPRNKTTEAGVSATYQF